MKKAALHNLGCKVNSYETDAMQRMLTEAGYTIVPFDDKADVYVINTCSVTNAADHKSRQMIHRAKKANPDGIVVAAGCYVQSADKSIAEDDAVDIILGNNRKSELIELLAQKLDEKKPDNRIEVGDNAERFEELGITQTGGHTRAFIKVQDGCNQFCTYCIIPYLRGRIKSRPEENILNECEALAKNGCREIVLSAIHLSSYGKDTGTGLPALLEKLSAIPGIERIRLGSLEPQIITRDFLHALACLPKVCPHFHLSLQSGSDTVLKRMNRHYTAGEYYEKCCLLREFYEHPAITTDIIVGFPGESEEEFLQTLQFARECAFADVHVFKYSKRAGTPAAAMPDQIPERVKQERSRILIDAARTMHADFVRWYEGRRVSVLFEETKPVQGRPVTAGYTPEYVRVTVNGDESLHNRIIELEFQCKLD